LSRDATVGRVDQERIRWAHKIPEIPLRKILPLLFLFTLVLGLAAAAADPKSSWVARAGVGVGPVLVNMDYDSVNKLLTWDKTRNTYQDKQPFHTFYTEGIQVHWNRSARAEQIIVEVPGIPTAEGVRVGDSRSRFEQVYGRDYTVSPPLPTAKSEPPQHQYFYTSRGIGFQTRGDSIILIYVFAKV
jgi:hypothetical protein